MLRVENLSFHMAKIQAIRNVSFELDKGEIMAIVGGQQGPENLPHEVYRRALKPQWGRST